MSTNSEAQAMLTEVKQGLIRSTEEVVPWFYENMNEYYFRSHSDEEQQEHLHAIISGQVTAQNQIVVLKNRSETRVTYITPGTDDANLIQILDQLRDTEIQTARIYTSFDRALRLDTFHFQIDEPKNGEARKQVLQAMLDSGKIAEEDEESLASFLDRATNDYVEKFEPDRVARHFGLLDSLHGAERVVTRLEKQVYPDQDRILVAMNHPPRTGTLLEMVKVLSRSGLRIRRLYADLFTGAGGDRSLIMTAYVEGSQELAHDSQKWVAISADLELIKWYHSGVLDWFAENRNWSLKKVSLLQGACKFAYQFLQRRFPDVYSSARIARIVLRHPDGVQKLIDLFHARFEPFVPARDTLVARHTKEVDDYLGNITERTERSVLEEIRDFFLHCKRTNYFQKSPFGLAFRMDGGIIPEVKGERPYGVFFFQGPAFQGFHVRYRDVARGGVRVVTTRTPEHYEMESKILLKEVIGLANSQQFKNKDIPEGGAKAVLLLRPYGEVDLAVKSMVDSLLDVIACTPEGTCPSYMVDHLQKQEIIYLGPDENISDKHIEWIIARAGKRGYPWPAALMSSKPRTGLNHKKYGVTSLGVIVYMEEVLKTIGIDPRQRAFRVKLTGGPAGDVAGNAMRILVGEYGENARIVSCSDGHGAAFDPAGLDHAELLNLIEKGRRIHEFDPGRLSGPDAFVVSTDSPEGIRIRNELHNTVQADIFIPAGGRPDTINQFNWRRFLDEGGRPSAPAIVEGANLFVSEEAREKLEEKGVLFIHGSSANKTGVITSSYEVLAGLILSDEEFLRIKDKYIEQVLEILRLKAAAEAKLLLREFTYQGGREPLSSISFAVSREINELSDLIARVLPAEGSQIREDPTLCDLLFSYCPPVLVQEFGGRILDQIPVQHQFAIVGASVSSKIVYSEGMGWLKRVAAVRDISEVLRIYLQQEKEIAADLVSLEQSDLIGKERLQRIVKAKGRKYLTAETLGLEGR
ncbi:MAG: NAD-glutamate dehydrogenase domain-containing protein [Desulfovibrionales bacterium]